MPTVLVQRALKPQAVLLRHSSTSAKNKKREIEIETSSKTFFFFFLVPTSAFHESVPDESLPALAGEVCRQVAALRVLHAPPRQLRDPALVDVPAAVSVALVPFVAGAEVAAQGVGAVAEDVARPVLALVVVRHVAALAAVAVVAVALGVQAGAVLAHAPGGVETVVWNRNWIATTLLKNKREREQKKSVSLVHFIRGLDSSEPW